MNIKIYFVKNSIELANYLKWSMVKHTVAGDKLIIFFVDDSDNKFFNLICEFTMMNTQLTIHKN